MPEIIVRKPLLDFSASLPHWNAGEPEFSQINNAGSTTLPHLEPYLIKVLLQARDALTIGKDDALLASVDLFIRQEANHYKQHQRYNDTLYENGYPGLKSHEQKLADDYKGFLAKRSLKFNLAYSEGFESMGIIQAEFIFKRAGHWLKDADDSVSILWQWHLAEEYEHRRVCFDVYQRLYGGYFYRVYGLFYAMWHLNGYGKRVSKFLIEQDHERGRIEKGLKSWWRETRYRMALASFGLFKLLRIISPFYDPGRLKMPAAAASLLEAVALADQAGRNDLIASESSPGAAE